jgi:class 3 adenylate cyclase/tetratricopeptide (TPR) repeat protein
MKCAHCQHDSGPSAKFCAECGAPLTPTCPSCGTALSSSAKFCPECGRPTGEVQRGHDKVLAPLSALAGERKQVTVLFADLKGSMELVADRDPEEARKILDPVLHLMMEAVHEYEGTVNQVMGDGIMALFGAPVAQEGHAVRACYAALRIQERMRRCDDELRRSCGVTVKIRIGLNSGEVVVRTIGSDLRMDYSAVGQTTHLAARMEQMAEPGAILATATTIRLAEGYVEASSRGRIHIKGLATPIDVYAVTGSGTAHTPIQAAAARGLTRFVGRAAEVAQLYRALASTAQGRGQVVGVVGEPGVGKSRLFYELTSARARDGWLVLHAAAASYGKTTAYRPVVDLLRVYFGVDGGDEHRDVQEVVRARLVALDPSLVSALPALVGLLQPGAASPEWQALDRRRRRQQTLDAVRRLVLRESEVQPTCLVLEDLHWIDSETHAFLDSLIDTLPAARLLLLLNYRPGFQHGWSGKTHYLQLHVNALGPESTHAVLSALVGDRDELTPLKRLLVERTDGNPFFLEESVRTLVENGALTGERGDYRLAQAVHVIEVPSTVQAVLAARIDRLAAEDKQLVQCASVIGEHVSVALLQAVADVPPDDVRDGLARLLAGEFLYESRSFPDPEYVFKHGLTRQVAYHSLLQERRRALHGRIVEYIEGHYPDRLMEHVERLADHAKRGELWDRAARHLQQAGAKAFAKYANREAVAWFEQALQALGHLPETAETQVGGIDVHLGLRNALTLLGEHERTLEHLRQAELLAERTGDRARLGRVLSFKANALLLLGRHEQAIDAGRRARDVATERGDVPLQTATDLYVGRAHLFLGNFQQAIEIFQGVVDALAGERARDHLGLPILPSVFARSHLVECLVELGRFADSARYAGEAVALAEAGNHPDTLLWAYHGAGIHHLARGEVEAATAAFERTYDLCQTHDMPVYVPRISAELALALALGGRGAEAVAMVQRAAEEAGARKQVATYSQVLLLLGEVCLLAGRLTEAHAAAVSVLDRFRQHGERAHEAWALRLLGDVAAQASPADVAGADTRYRASRDLAAALGMAPLIARCDRALSDLARRAPAEPGGLG